MSLDVDLAQRLSALMNTLGSGAETVQRNPRSTVEPLREDKSGRRALEVLRGLHFDPKALEPREVLGQGGMGVVRLAQQVSLDRLVAVKTLKDASSPGDVEALLSEAWLAGALEHPAILPIYSLALDAEGRPQVVMKRIEGVTWSKLLVDDGELPTYAPGRDRLESHLRVLMQLCNAVHFANSRGVVHRDLKPDNVMLGRFGEVVLVDWGIATTPGPSTHFAGTPAYMAPEMLGDGVTPLSSATDVYLLGATLFEVVTGRPPHLFGTTQQMLESVMRSSPPLPPETPPELAELIVRCMARKPADRPTSALAVRQALGAFLEHQGSREVERQSSARAAELTALLAQASPDSLQVARLATECRFGFQQALQLWPGNARARAALDRVTLQLVQLELGHGAVRAARALLAELAEPPTTIVEQLTAAEAAAEKRERDVERLKRIAKAFDPGTASRPRLIIALAFGVLWALSPLLTGALQARLPDVDEALLFLPSALLSVAALIPLALSRREEMRSVLNQHLVRMVLYCMVFQIVASVALWALGAPLGRLSVPLIIGFWAFGSGLATVLIVPDIWPTPVAFGLSMVGSLRWPDWRFEFLSLACAVLVLNCLQIFLRLEAERQGRRPKRRRPDAG